MKTYIFTEHEDSTKSESLRATANRVVQHVADGTDTERLVVAIYLMEESSISRGELASVRPVRRSAFASPRSTWAFATRFAIPDDLPESFALIRMAMGSLWRRKRIAADYIGLTKFRGFDDHLAFLFAHELHHFRRYHLGLHPGEGEIAASRWAVQHVTSLGYKVEVTPRRRRRLQAQSAAPRVPTEPNPSLLRRIKARAANLCVEDLKSAAGWMWGRAKELEDVTERSMWAEHYRLLRSLPAGAHLQVVRDSPRPDSRVGQVMTKVRTLKRGSKRIAVRDQSGKVWYWPMRWLKPVQGQPVAAQSELAIPPVAANSSAGTSSTSGHEARCH
jgi:hypothetical protein